MKLTFRQGVARHQTDISGNPTFLKRSSSNGQFVDLVVSPTPTVLAFAHRDGTYLVEELKSVPNAWGPVSPGNSYLYWDVNLLNAVLTRGITEHPPIYSADRPNSPQNDQHWFDLSENVMRVWNGAKWVEKIRLFAGRVSSGSIIHPIAVGSQANILGNFECGSIVLDSYGMPLRQSNGCFVTTVSWLGVVNLGTVTARLDSAIMSGMAAEELPKFSLVQLRPGRRLVLARSTDYSSRVAGIVTEDLFEGEVGRVVSTGVVHSMNWSFPDDSVNRPVFCGPTGEVTTEVPQAGVVQQVGFVYDANAIFVDIKQVVVLEEPTGLEDITAPLPTIPEARFTMDVTSGLAPLKVKFTNTSVNAEGFEWDFSNDGYVDTTATNPSFTFTEVGKHTVRLRAINSYGIDDEIKPNVITVVGPNVQRFVNLGISLGAPNNVTATVPFSFQVLVSNDGSYDATNVSREIILRSNTGSNVDLVDPPLGVTVQRDGQLLKVSLPSTAVAAGQHTTFTLRAVCPANVTSLTVQGVASCDQTDRTVGDNITTLSIGVRA